MKTYLNLLISLVFLAVVLDAKRPKPVKPGKPGKPIKPIKPVPIKPPKPATPLPPTLATMMPPEPVSPEGLSANAMFDEMAFATLPGCLVCLNLFSRDCILPCYNTPENPPECLLCLIEKAVSCIGACGFTNLAAAGAYPSPSQEGCIMQGQGLKLTGPAPDGNIDEVMENVGSAAECGQKCVDSAQWTYANKFAADQAQRFNCWCLNEDKHTNEFLPRFDMDSGNRDCPPTPIPTLPVPV